MSSFAYRLTAHSRATPEVLFDLVSDAPSWGRWARVVPSARWEDPQLTGPGAVRLMGRGRLGMRERVVAEDRPHRHEYAMDATFPARDYRAVVQFSATPTGGTDVVWEATFSAAPGIGHAYQALLSRGIVASLLKDLVRAGDTTA